MAMDSPVSVAAEKATVELERIVLPTVETFEPKELGAAAAAYAIAVRKVQEADREIAKLRAEQLERDARMKIIDACLAQSPGPIIDVWCANYTITLIGIVNTTEVPGYWLDEPVAKSAVVGDPPNTRTVFYDERSWNIAPSGTLHPPHGDLHFSAGMSDAAVAYNLTMEPGHLKWRPIWRYGILLADAQNDRCTLRLNPATARELPASLSEESLMDINDEDEEVVLSGVPISYPPCNGSVFKMDDEVLVLFEGQQRDAPKVIGFRRRPKRCSYDKTWDELR